MDINVLKFVGPEDDVEDCIDTHAGGIVCHGSDSDTDRIIEELSETDISKIKLYEGIKNMVEKSAEMIVRQRTARKKKRKRATAAAAVAPDHDEDNKAYSRCSLPYLYQVIQKINCSEHRINLVRKMGFQETLEIDDCYIPRAFAQWIADNTRPDAEVIKIHDKSIPINPKSFQDVLGIPAGDLPVETDNLTGKVAFLECFGLSEVPNIRYFGDKIINDPKLEDDEFCRCYGAVVLGAFICPNSSPRPSTKYLGALVDVDNIQNRNWAKFAHEWMMWYVKKYLKERAKQNKLTYTLGGCIYKMAVRYLDFIDIGSIKLPSTLPRIRVWKGDLIKHFSEMDKGKDGNYGSHTIKDVSQTCYAAATFPTSVEFQHQFRKQINEVAGDHMSKQVKDDLFCAFQNHMIHVNSDMYLRAQLLVLDFLNIIVSEGIDRQPSGTTMLMGTQDSPRGQDEDEETQTQKRRKIDVNNEKEEVSQSNIALDSNSKQEDLHPQMNDQQQSNEVPSRHARSFSLNHTPSGDDGINSSSFSDKIQKQPLSEKRAVGITIMPCIAQEYIAPDPKPDVFAIREEYLKEASKKYYWLDPLVPSMRLFEDVDDNGKYIEEKELWRPLPGDLDQNVNNDCKHVEKNSNINDLNKEPEPEDSVGLYADDYSPPHQPNTSFAYSAPKHSTPVYKSNADNEFEFSSIQCAQRQPPYYFNGHSETNVDQKKNTIELIVLDSSQPSQPSPITPVNSERSTSYLKGRRLFDEETSNNEEHNKQIPKSFDDKLKEHMAPEVEYLGERVFKEVCNNMAATADELYNAGLTLGSASVSNGKENLPPKRVLNPSTFLRSPYDNHQKRILQPKELKLYETITTLCDDEAYADTLIINIDNCKVWLRQLGKSMKQNGWVEAWVINAICRKLFKDNHPRISKKHFFFHTASEYFLEKWPNEYMRERWKASVIKGFHGAGSARKLHLSDRLYFPSLWERHWFVFAVDMKARSFLFLDSLCGETSSYHRGISNRMITNFKAIWNECNLKEMDFGSFGILYPNMPQQNNPDDCGVYSIKFMELFCPRNPMQYSFSSEDIPHFRVELAVDTLFNEHNTEYEGMHLISSFDLKNYNSKLKAK